MDFHETGLPDHQLVRDAFEFSKANMLAHKDDFSRDIERQIKMGFDQQIQLLDKDKADGKLKAEEHAARKSTLDMMLQEQLRQLPQIVDGELNNALRHRLYPVQEIQLNSEKPSDEALAALILLDCVRSPLDHADVEKKFGKKIANLVAHIIHVDLYPSQRSTLLSGYDSEIQRVYTALIVSGLDDVTYQAEMLKQLNIPQKAAWLPEMIFDNAKAMWGNDKKLDKRLVTAFNKAAEVTAAPFRMEVDADGGPELVRSAGPTDPNKIIPPPPKKGGKNNKSDIIF